ncbi:hypothetical protein [Anabaena sp. CS-542/02]|uniref:hypothetical protein n=1 Tax=Anabaena sp. CS-542/02 TaxID=3021719 RepID=UPI003FA476B9
MYRTIPIRARFTDEEKAFWVDQCQHSNSLINCAIYHTRQSHYARLESMDNAFTTYWCGDELRSGWKTYYSQTTYPELDKVLKENPHYKGLAAQAAANILRKVATQLGLSLVEVGRASLTVPQRYDLFKRLNKSYRKRCLLWLGPA